MFCSRTLPHDDMMTRWHDDTMTLWHDVDMSQKNEESQTKLRESLSVQEVQELESH